MTMVSGDVIPSFLQTAQTQRYYEGGNFDNFALRLGEVQELVYPDDVRSRSKKFTEYRVLVQQSSNGTGNAKLYENCLLMSLFGGIADRVEFTFRADDSKSKSSAGLGKGSKVLVLCVNGETNHAFIVGGVRDQSDNSDKDKVKDLGHHFYAVFNGASFFIDKDGQFVATYNGKTDIDGKRNKDVGESQVGSTFKMGQNGNVQIADKDAKNAVTVDHENKKVLIAHEKGVEIGKATDKMPLFSTYRDAEGKLNRAIADKMTNLYTQLSIASGVLQAIGATFKAASVEPAVAAAAASFDILAQNIKQAAEAANAVVKAVVEFETNASKYLSRYNSND